MKWDRGIFNGSHVEIIRYNNQLLGNRTLIISIPHYTRRSKHGGFLNIKTTKVGGSIFFSTTKKSKSSPSSIGIHMELLSGKIQKRNRPWNSLFHTMNIMVYQVYHTFMTPSCLEIWWNFEGLSYFSWNSRVGVCLILRQTLIFSLVHLTYHCQVLSNKHGKPWMGSLVQLTVIFCCIWIFMLATSHPERHNFCG